MPFSPDPETLVIFTTSPTGLGHIRVMNALIQGLSTGINYSIIGVKDVNAAKIHALGSRLPIALKITEFIQNNPLAEKIVTKIYQKYYSTRTQSLLDELAEVHFDYPLKSTWVIISTHFALSYPVIAVKKFLSEKLKINIINILVVTDDSPQRVWAADGCDIIFVPSLQTEKRLRELMPKETKTVIKTVSFPVSPRLSVKMADEELELLQTQLDPSENKPLHISVPISGAAVQLDFIETIIKTLTRDKFIFTVIGQLTPYTASFFINLKDIPRVQISSGTNAQSTVKLYESSFFQGLRPAVEITKPSEQTFKAILKPNEKGGVILLLSDPVGRQENDNLKFLIRNELLANEVEQKKLEKYLVQEGKIPEDEEADINYRASHWRALKLPQNPLDAAIFIKNAKKTGLLHTMLSYVPENKKDLTSSGVAQIWNTIDEMLKYRAHHS